jgi:hypothetical protein
MDDDNDVEIVDHKPAPGPSKTGMPAPQSESTASSKTVRAPYSLCLV